MKEESVLIQNELENIVFKNCSQPIAISSCDGRIILVNQAFCNLLGYTKVELSTLNCAKDLTPEAWQLSESVHLARLIQTKQSIHYETKYIHKNGNKIPIAIVAHIVVNSEGKPLYKYSFITDISNQKQIATAKLSSMLDDIPEGLYMLDKDWRLTYINHNARLLLGKIEKDILGKDFRTVLPISPDFYETFQKSLATGQSQYFIGYSSCAKRWLETHTFPSKNGITVLLKAVEVQKQAKERYKNFFELNPNPMIIGTLAEERHFDVNCAFLKLTGYKREEIIGRLFKETNMFTLATEGQKILKILKEKKSIDNYEMSIRNKSGEIRFILCNIKTIEMDSKAYILTSIIDITERKNAQERFDKAFHDNTSPMAITRLADFQYVDVNQAWVNITGYTRSETIGFTSMDLNTYKNKKDAISVLKKVKSGKKISNLEIQIQHKSGKVKTLLICFDLIKLNGEDHILSAGIDISERKHFEQIWARSDRLDLIGQMAIGISHELRNPMTTVRGYLQLFLRKEQFKDFISPIKLMIKELDRANNIISEFLFLAKNRAVERKACYLPDIIKQIIPLVEADGIIANINVVTNFATVPQVQIDSKEIQRLLLNLGYYSGSS